MPNTPFYDPLYGFQADRASQIREARLASKRAAAKAAAKRRATVNKKTIETRKLTSIVPRELLVALPKHLQPIVREIALDENMAEGIKAMMGRERSFSSPMAALLAGVIVHGPSAQLLDQRLDEHWATRKLPKTSREVIIGAGLHAAVYSAARVASGGQRPLVIDRATRAGGTFAISHNAAFYLNSRNRPGPLSLPGLDGALNVIPGAPLQPADLDSAEYQTNVALAWVIRIALAMFADVVVDKNVAGVYAIGDGLELDIDDAITSTDRVIIASGPGREFRPQPNSDRVMTFSDFMRRMDEPFPLRDMKRVAVVGSGDAGKTTVEALTGQGPSSRWSVASVDWVDQIDWYGCAQQTRGDFEACNRGRYRRIGRLLDQSNSARLRRVVPRSERAGPPSLGFESILINERPYDHVIWCAGYEPEQVALPGDGVLSSYYSGERAIATRLADEEVYAVGPAAGIGLSGQETVSLGSAASVPENSTALFRYASRTAALAAALS